MEYKDFVIVLLTDSEKRSLEDRALKENLPLFKLCRNLIFKKAEVQSGSNPS